MTLQKNLNRLRDESLRIAVEHGFTEADVPTDLMLMVSEAAEALEDHRAHHKANEVWYEEKSYGMKPCGIPSEVADVVVRVLHFSGKHDINIEHAVSETEIYWKDSRRTFKKDASIAEELLRMSAEFYKALAAYDRGLRPNFLLYRDRDGRVHTEPLSPLREPVGIPACMASAILHAMHFADKHGFDLLHAVKEKSAFNDKRPYMNGNKAI